MTLVRALVKQHLLEEVYERHMGRRSSRARVSNAERREEGEKYREHGFEVVWKSINALL
jgi:hypothetical protein